MNKFSTFTQTPWLKRIAILSALFILAGYIQTLKNKPKEELATLGQERIVSTYVVEQIDASGQKINGLSGLAWDADDKIVYAISDHGELFHFKLIQSEGKIENLELIKITTLSNETEVPYSKELNDAEGLDILRGNNGISGDAQLLVAFEKTPRVSWHEITGRLVRQHSFSNKNIQKELQENPNKSFESVLHHSQLGLLVGLEKSENVNNLSVHTIIDETGFRQWKFYASPLPSPSFSGMSELANGNVLVMERDFNDDKKEFSLALSKLSLNKCGTSSICKPEVLLLTNSSEYPALGSFEGIAKLSDTEFLIISDNSKSKLHQTLLAKIKLN